MDMVGRNQKVIAKYIQNQLQEDRVADQLTLFETVDPFTGETNRKKPDGCLAQPLLGKVVREEAILVGLWPWPEQAAYSRRTNYQFD